MKKENRMFMLLTIAAIMCLFGLTSVQAQTATSFSGNATGVIADANILGGTAVVGATIAPTGSLDTTTTTPARRTNQVLQGDVAATIQLGGVLGSGNTVSTGLVNTRTSGGAAGVAAGDPGATNNSSQSQAVVNNLNLNIAAVTDPLTGLPLSAALNVSATTITANTNCVCGPTCTGTSLIKDLSINGLLVGSTALPFTTIAGTVTLNADGTLSATPNSQIRVTLGTTTVDLFLNEQTRTPAGSTNNITVNALRIAANIPGVATTNIIVAQAHSDIVCAAVVTPPVVPPLESADLVLTKNCTISNNVITCTITVRNNGPNTATNVVITDNLPTNTTFVSATGSAGVTTTFTPAASGSTGGTVTGSIATLLINQSASLTVVSNVAPGTPANTPITNIATVASTTTPDPVSANNEAMSTVTTQITTAASATISGRVSTSKGRGLPRATVALTAPNGDVMYAVTNQRGYYRFADLEVGENYVLSVRSKRYVFETKTVFVTQDLAEIDFAPMQ
jgi:uncharacterized repeat protein (TIGR01451 family)